MKNLYELPCNIAQTLNILGDKWTMLVLRQIMNGKNTYKQISENLKGISTNLLAKRLKSLESDGLIEKVLYEKHPPRYNYILTESGRDLGHVFNSLIIWGEKHVEACDKQISHIDCGHQVEHRYFCPKCDKGLSVDEVAIQES